MFLDVHIDNDGKLLVDMPAYLRRHDVVYQSPAYEPVDGLPVGEGDIAGLFSLDRDKIRFFANKSNLFDDCPDGDFGAWGSEWEEKQTALVSGGELIVTDGLPSFDDLYLCDFEKRLNLGRGLVELRSKTPFSEWNGTVCGSRADRVMLFSYSTKAEYPVSRTVSLKKWGSRSFLHYYEHFLTDPTVRLGGTQAYAEGDIGYIRVSLSQIEYVIAAKIVSSDSSGPCGGKIRWNVANPHDAQAVLPAAEQAEFDILLTIVTSEDAPDPVGEAFARLNAAAKDTGKVIVNAEEDWKEFSSRCFVKLDDDYFENMYYFNMYQMYIAFRGPFPSYFTGSQFIWNHDIRNWGHFYHWNNQIPYWGVQASNHTELFDSYADFRRGMLENAEADAAAQGYDGAFYSDICNRRGGQALEPDSSSNCTCGPQIAMDLYRQWEYTGDEQYLRETALPVLEAVVRYYLSRMRKEEDGKWHMESATVCENYLALRDTVTDRVYAESVGRAYLKALDALGESSEWKEKAEDLVGNLYPFYTVEHEGKTVFSCGLRGDGTPLPFRTARYPEGTGGVGEISMAYMGAEFCLMNLTEEQKVILRDSYDASLRNRPSDCGHTPYGIITARLGLPVRPILFNYIDYMQIFPSGLSHFVDFRHDKLHSEYYMPRIVEPGEKFNDWSKIHEHSEYKRLKIEKARFIHPYLEAMGQYVETVNESLLQSTCGLIRVFPAEDAKTLTAFRLLARGGVLVTSEKREDVRYIALEATRDGTFRVEMPWNCQLCLKKNGRVEYSEPTDILEVSLKAGETCVIYPRSRQLEVMYQSHFEDDVINNGVKTCGRSVLGTERNF